MNKLMIAIAVSATLGFAGTAAAQTTAMKSASAPITKDNYAMAKTNAEAQYKLDKDACGSLSGNAKDICIAEAKGKENDRQGRRRSRSTRIRPRRASTPASRTLRRPMTSRSRNATTWPATTRRYA